MPARFVEVSSPIHAARNSDPLGYVQTMKWNVSAWGASTFDSWVGTGNETNSSSFGSSIARASTVLSTVLSTVAAPTGPARWALYAAVLLIIIRWVLLRRATRRVVSEYGHAHAE